MFGDRILTLGNEAVDKRDATSGRIGGLLRRRLRLVVLCGSDHALVLSHTWRGFRDGVAGSDHALVLLHTWRGFSDRLISTKRAFQVPKFLARRIFRGDPLAEFETSFFGQIDELDARVFS